MRLEEMRWPECAEIDWADAIAIVPLGSTEQHGRHMPSGTDAMLVGAIAGEVEARLGNRVLLTPTMWLGHSPHHLAFGATLSLNHTAYADMLCGVMDSLQGMGCERLLLLNGHGGNHVPALAALQEMKDRHPSFVPMLANYWALAPREILEIVEGGASGMGHAGELETSLMMWLRPDLVCVREIRDAGRGDCPAGTDYQGYMLSGSPISYVSNFQDFTDTGAFGKPTLASASKGQRLFVSIASAVEQLVLQMIQQAREAR